MGPCREIRARTQVFNRKVTGYSALVSAFKADLNVGGLMVLPIRSDVLTEDFLASNEKLEHNSVRELYQIRDFNNAPHQRSPMRLYHDHMEYG